MTISMDDMDFFPLTPQRWDDLAALFGPSGAYGGCWCMFWRETRQEFSLNCRNKGEGNREALHALVDSGVVPGILGYRGGVPLVWCSIAPREDFPALERSRNLKRLDDQPVWSIVCFLHREIGPQRRADDHYHPRGGGVRPPERRAHSGSLSQRHTQPPLPRRPLHGQPERISECRIY